MIVAALLLSMTLPPAATGSITGTITTSAKPLAPIRVTIDQKVCGDQLPDEAITVDAQGHLANAVVTLVGVKRTITVDPVVTNEKCRFSPRVQLARPNATVRTTSKDPMLHTTQAQHADGKVIFNVALPIAGINMNKPVGPAGLVRLSCNIHPWMRGWIVTTDDAAAVSGADGKFAIANVPPGTYEVRVWHETLKGPPQKVTVTAGKAAVINYQLK
jgi:hypothetical protein